MTLFMEAYSMDFKDPFIRLSDLRDMNRFHLGTWAVMFCALAACLSAQPRELKPGAPAFAPRLDPLNDPPQTEAMQIERDYDRFQDKTTIRVEGIRPGVTKGESRIFLNAVCSYDGADVAGKPDKVAINLLSVSEEFQYVDLREGLQFILLIDSKRIKVPAKFVKAGTTREKDPKSLESFVAIVDADMLVAMATAQSVEAQLGNAEFKLGAMEQLSLRKFAETVNLVAPLPKPALAELPQLPGPARVDAVAVHLAQARIDEAQEKVDKLTAACLKRLEQTPVYTAALNAAQDLEEKKDKLAPGAERADISQQWLEARAKVGLIKSSALLEDNELTAARRQLGEAQGALRGMKKGK